MPQTTQANEVLDAIKELGLRSMVFIIAFIGFVQIVMSAVLRVTTHPTLVALTGALSVFCGLLTIRRIAFGLSLAEVGAQRGRGVRRLHEIGDALFVALLLVILFSNLINT